jgi:beta-N-acetylhexosaminidase
LSRAILGDLLRTELGFDGVIVSDALDMAGAHTRGGLGETAVRALAAGCDLLCLGTNNTDADLSAIEAAASGNLAPERVREATNRVLALADMRPEPVEGPSPSPGRLTESELVSTFDTQPTAERWLASRPAAVRVVRLEARPNSAAGPVPWGPPRTGSDVVVSADRPLPSTPTADEAVLVVGQDIHRHAFARAAVDRLRAEHPNVLVVDMGWPAPDRQYADVATFGASALMGRALLQFLRLG